MTKREYCINHHSIAYYSGFSGLEIKGIEYGIDDYVVFQSGCWGSPAIYGYHKAKIYYTDRPYFMLNGYRIHLDECIRI